MKFLMTNYLRLLGTTYTKTVFYSYVNTTRIAGQVDIYSILKSCTQFYHILKGQTEYRPYVNLPKLSNYTRKCIHTIVIKIKPSYPLLLKLVYTVLHSISTAVVKIYGNILGMTIWHLLQII